MRFSIFILALLFPLLLHAQKNRISLGYHQAYTIERDDLSKLGIQLSLERSWGKQWSTTLEWSKDEYCRCDVLPYEYRLRGRYRLLSSSPSREIPAFGYFSHWSIYANYKWSHPHYPTIQYSLGTGIVYRTGAEIYLFGITPFEVFAGTNIATDWAIPLRISLTYRPSDRWWGFTAFLLYQGYFDYTKDYGNNPMNVLHGGLNFDIRLGKREELKRK